MTFIVHTSIRVDETALLDKIQDEGGYTEVSIHQTGEREYTIEIKEVECEDECDVLEDLELLAEDCAEDSLL
jgi:hypothetical protein